MVLAIAFCHMHTKCQFSKSIAGNSRNDSRACIAHGYNFVWFTICVWPKPEVQKPFRSVLIIYLMTIKKYPDLKTWDFFRGWSVRGTGSQIILPCKASQRHSRAWTGERVKVQCTLRTYTNFQPYPRHLRVGPGNR